MNSLQGKFIKGELFDKSPHTYHISIIKHSCGHVLDTDKLLLISELYDLVKKNYFSALWPRKNVTVSVKQSRLK